MNRGRPRRRAGPGGRGCVGVGRGDLARAYAAVGRAGRAVRVTHDACTMTMQAHADLPNDPTVLRTIVREAGQPLSIDASVAQPGRVAVGDVVDVRSGVISPGHAHHP